MIFQQEQHGVQSGGTTGGHTSVSSCWSSRIQFVYWIPWKLCCWEICFLFLIGLFISIRMFSYANTFIIQHRSIFAVFLCVGRLWQMRKLTTSTPPVLILLLLPLLVVLHQPHLLIKQVQTCFPQMQEVIYF